MRVTDTGCIHIIHSLRNTTDASADASSARTAQLGKFIPSYRYQEPPTASKYDSYLPPVDTPTSTRALGVKSILETAQNWILSRKGSVKGRNHPAMGRPSRYT